MEAKRLKLLFCQTQFKLGGQQKVLLTIAEELGKKHDVTIYYENHSFFDLSKFTLIRPNKIVQLLNLFLVLIKHFFTLNFNKKLIADDWHLRNLKKTLAKKEYDIVILLNPYILFVDEIRKLLKTKKVVCWTHNIFENYVNNCFKDEQKKLFSSMQSADQIVSLERYTAAKWSEYNPNVTIIHNPITIDNDNKRANLKSKKISFVGRIQIDMKGLDYLIQLAKLLDPDITIHIAGSGNSREERQFKKMLLENVDRCQ
ncbi:glycosyltransferase [Enterococcus dongliensis]|uniref:Glycosyltransferase n=1 Tax=Enterococcus dongliensis TaxID=2559925 RepID=A0AAW8TI34_9ENTE|nr:glycosyltransferase [Enterococcus dongliensis]MDT2634655.1 glycosyltransferase [Enterococcus dongliensis]MDT2637521.1 glycosyltransferase [Enterococcus dongliensis]MDT2642673.1 glycosyltransferase [Enterococcus dongliensis]